MQVFQPAFDAANMLSLIKQHGVTSFISVPAMVVSMCEAASQVSLATAQESRQSVRGRAAYPSVRVILLGGGELPGRLKAPLRMVFPSAQIVTAYGMTEACSSMTFGPLDMPCCWAAPGEQPQHENSAAAAVPAGAEPAAAQAAAGSLPGGLSRSHRRSGPGLGRDVGGVGSGAVPVGWPPPGIEVCIAPLQSDGSSASSKVRSHGSMLRRCYLPAHPLPMLAQQARWYTLTHATSSCSLLHCLGEFIPHQDMLAAVTQNECIHCSTVRYVGISHATITHAGWRDPDEGTPRHVGILGRP